MTVWGHPTSKVMVSIESLFMVLYLTSIVSKIVFLIFLMVFKISDVEVLWPRSRTVQGHLRSKVMVPIDSPWTTSYSTFIDRNIISVTVFQNLTSILDDLELGQFKVIQGQRSWCQFIAHGWLPIRFLLTPTSYVSPFLKIFDL